ncbi:unnamed protein product [Malus baccata var. baccata]
MAACMRGVKSAEMAETMAVRTAVHFAYEVSCSALEVHGDAVVVINALQATDAAALSEEFGHILNDARHILKSFSQRRSRLVNGKQIR